MSYSSGKNNWRVNTVQAWGGKATFRQQRLRPRGGVLNTAINGISRDATGAPLGSCVVELLQSGGDILTQSTVSDSGGNFSFVNPGSGPFFIRAYKDGSPNVAGVTDRNLVAV